MGFGTGYNANEKDVAIARRMLSTKYHPEKSDPSLDGLDNA